VTGLGVVACSSAPPPDAKGLDEPEVVAQTSSALTSELGSPEDGLPTCTGSSP
jgi:hypothetical protein